MLIFNMYRRGLMPNLIKKSWTVSMLAATAKLLEPRSIKLFQLRQVLTDLRDQKGREDFLKLSLSLFNSWDNH